MRFSALNYLSAVVLSAVVSTALAEPKRSLDTHGPNATSVPINPLVTDCTGDCYSATCVPVGHCGCVHTGMGTSYCIPY
ncbi:hypothetical protein DFH09DRAFT_1177788 [Mycena vulgaris]|nr:hypothetical protein DFH09DRAFT_1177788 [Mycena vulgaris]